MNVLLEPFSYEYMLNAMWVSAMVDVLRSSMSFLVVKGFIVLIDADAAVALYCPGVLRT